MQWSSEYSVNKRNKIDRAGQIPLASISALAEYSQRHNFAVIP